MFQFGYISWSYFIHIFCRQN
uniref:Uncharacterized protein n=1 Tax=Anguilla anguilla TaxID=7936 RepID=A0A0E9S1G1_ANGAN